MAETKSGKCAYSKERRGCGLAGKCKKMEAVVPTMNMLMLTKGKATWQRIEVKWLSQGRKQSNKVSWLWQWLWGDALTLTVRKQWQLAKAMVRARSTMKTMKWKRQHFTVAWQAMTLGDSANTVKAWEMTLLERCRQTVWQQRLWSVGDEGRCFSQKAKGESTGLRNWAAKKKICSRLVTTFWFRQGKQATVVIGKTLLWGHGVWKVGDDCGRRSTWVDFTIWK